MRHFPIKPEAQEKIRKHILAVAERAGQPMAEKEIQFVGLSKDHFSHDALFIESGQKENIREYVEYPFDEKTDSVKDGLHETVLCYIVRKLAADLRARCKSEGQVEPHLNATLNSIWIDRLEQKHPDHKILRIYGETDASIATKIDSKEELEISPGDVRFRLKLPESVKAKNLNILGNLISFPDCGDEDVQRMFENQCVYSIEETQAGKTVLKTSTVTYPLREGDDVYPWRELLKVRKNLPVMLIMARSHKDPLASADDLKKIIDEFFAKNGTPEDWYRQKKAA